jgi:hypothetical protein
VILSTVIPSCLYFLEFIFRDVFDSGVYSDFCLYLEQSSFFLMALCSVEDVRAHANPVKISDADITSIISVVTTEILTKANTTLETDPYLIQAAIHAAAAITLKRARAIGELSSNKTPEFEISFTGIIEEIKQHEAERDNYIKMYKTSIPSYSFSSVSLHAGFTHHNHCGGRNY